MIAPRLSTTRRWHSAFMASRLCSTTTKVMPSSRLARLMFSIIRSISIGFTPAIGSSSRITRGSGISMEANCSSFCCPNEMRPAGA